MSDEREQTKPPNEREQTKPPNEPDFQLHQLKEGTIEPEPEAGDKEEDDFEAHILKPGGVADVLKP